MGTNFLVPKSEKQPVFGPTWVPKTKIIWGTVPETQEWDRIFYHFGPFCSWDIKTQDSVFCYLGPFFALWPSWKHKKSKFWRNFKKHLEILSFHTCVPQMPITWCMVAEIIECNRPPICFLSPIYPMIYGSWDVKCNRQNFFVILGHFLPFYTPNSPKKWKFHKNEKNTWRYHHSTQVYQK